MKPEIILIDDDKNLNQILTAHLKDGGYKVSAFTDPQDGVKRLKEGRFHLVITDMKMKPLDGLEVLKEAKRKNADIPVIMITGHGTIETAVQSMKLGAHDYITKPFSRDEFLHIVGNAIDHFRLKEENRQLKKDLSGRFDFSNIIGKSGAVVSVLDLAEKALDYDVTVLITGESGTGKELIARAIHYNGSRKDKPFVVVNCASIPDNLIESELFGHVVGAFTGAVKDRNGKFQGANGGSIFLDEIGDLKLDLQVKLLRVLQEGEFERIGEGKLIKVDVRVIAATNKDLEGMTQQGGFRVDLYYRLSVFPVHMPPLRERNDDIPLLVEHFLRKHSKEDSSVHINQEVMKALQRYDWPGNVRELENMIERALVLSNGEKIGPEHFSEKLLESKEPTSQKIEIPAEGINLVEIEKEYILQALEKTNGKRARAARLLGISRPTLIYRMEKHGLGQKGDQKEE